MGCGITGNLRISGGFLQICKNNTWRGVCNEDWGNLDAAVACRQLGYDGKLLRISSTYTSYSVVCVGGYSNRTTSSAVIVDSEIYHCTGQENNLQDCDSETSRGCRLGVVTTCVQRNASGKDAGINKLNSHRVSPSVYINS